LSLCFYVFSSGDESRLSRHKKSRLSVLPIKSTMLAASKWTHLVTTKVLMQQTSLKSCCLDLKRSARRARSDSAERATNKATQRDQNESTNTHCNHPTRTPYGECTHIYHRRCTPSRACKCTHIASRMRTPRGAPKSGWCETKQHVCVHGSGTEHDAPVGDACVLQACASGCRMCLPRARWVWRTGERAARARGRSSRRVCQRAAVAAAAAATMCASELLRCVASGCARARCCVVDMVLE
jgi:hypothetical protein